MTPLTTLETASGVVLGLEPDARVEPAGARPLFALEDAIRPFLRRPPCLVSFSGGRDSSAILATATALARREGLPLPIPATNRFPQVEESHERAWQEQVVRALRLEDWIRLDLDDELDCVGPVATAALRRHGVLVPFNAHFHVPLLRAASGGALLTGIGGDEVFGDRGRSAAVVARAVRPELRDVLRIGLAISPHPVRRRVLQWRDRTALPWMTSRANGELSSAWARFAASEPLRWSAYLRWCSRLRYLRLGIRSLDLLAADEGAQVSHPFLDARFLGALTPGGGNVDRGAAMSALFGELLPPGVLTRATKASFDRVFFTRHSREFASGWDGTGADTRYVDVARLRATWASPTPVPQSFMQLQAAWLAASGAERVEQPLEPVVGAFRVDAAPVLERG
jgi:asparagine synthase (glutamine-hydrolysing)